MISDRNKPIRKDTKKGDRNIFSFIVIWEKNLLKSGKNFSVKMYRII